MDFVQVNDDIVCIPIVASLGMLGILMGRNLTLCESL